MQPHRRPMIAAAWRGERDRRGMRYHFTMFVGAVVVLALARLLELQGTTHVAVPVGNLVLPELCSFQRFFGIPCPGCGLTRSFVALARGDVAAAWTFNPAGLLLFATVIFQLPYRAMQIVRLWRGQGEFHSNLLPLSTIPIGVALVVQWVWRLMVR